ncbi:MULTISPECIES: hypothetical protein [unclassified Sphingomonas]|jgi:hypothetical protein|uniref:hypothetical protein n=1 Tax=unclassified Sphingomonas TaxID=196159 RepID=UPI000A84233D|nr:MULTISPECIES: hypothetical protein [unclassified Sphingomonas]
MNELPAVASAALAVMMIAVFALTIGAVVLIRRGDWRKGGLMLAAAAVMLGNVLIWTV